MGGGDIQGTVGDEPRRFVWRILTGQFCDFAASAALALIMLSPQTEGAAEIKSLWRSRASTCWEGPHATNGLPQCDRRSSKMFLAVSIPNRPAGYPQIQSETRERTHMRAFLL
jgi:hypothetical protein